MEPRGSHYQLTRLGLDTLGFISSPWTLCGQNNCTPFLVETEYWGQMHFNLLVESSTEEVADLLRALSHTKVN